MIKGEGIGRERDVDIVQFDNAIAGSTNTTLRQLRNYALKMGKLYAPQQMKSCFSHFTILQHESYDVIAR